MDNLWITFSRFARKKVHLKVCRTPSEAAYGLLFLCAGYSTRAALASLAALERLSEPVDNLWISRLASLATHPRFARRRQAFIFTHPHNFLCRLIDYKRWGTRRKSKYLHFRRWGTRCKKKKKKKKEKFSVTFLSHSCHIPVTLCSINRAYNIL